LFLIEARGHSPLVAALTTLPIAVSALAVSVFAGRIDAALGLGARLAGGLTVCAAGVLLIRAGGVALSLTDLLPGFLVLGAGAGLVNPALVQAALAQVPVEHAAAASATTYLSRQLALSGAVAGLTGVLEAGLRGGERYAVALDAVLLVVALTVGLAALTVVGVMRLRDASLGQPSDVSGAA
jgi:hypothetical protein